MFPRCPRTIKLDISSDPAPPQTRPEVSLALAVTTPKEAKIQCSSPPPPPPPPPDFFLWEKICKLSTQHQLFLSYNNLLHSKIEIEHDKQRSRVILSLKLRSVLVYHYIKQGEQGDVLGGPWLVKSGSWGAGREGDITDTRSGLIDWPASRILKTF